ncbi:MAG: YihY/virulence factor BrkB family protein [Sediminibacterium sp.]|nr:YihY/virulence factor BrkB family protein [Sediminibacterium sp.]
MANVVTLIKKSWHFVTIQMWHFRLEKLNKRQGFLLKQLRIFSLAIQGFNEDKCLTKATALTFYTLFSIVPILALAFALAKGFGFEKNLEQQLMENYGEYSEVLSKAFIYADSLLATTKGGIIAGFGVVLLLWSVMNLLVSIENSFNEIWEVKRGRSWTRKFTDYITIMVVSPFFLIISGSLTVAIQAKLGNIVYFNFIGTFLLKMIAWALLAGVFTFLYMVLPNLRVQFKSAAVAAIIATVLFHLLQWAYIKFQIGANRMNAIYGGFAALPLFLIWVQYSWYIVLFGAELAFANQNVEHYEMENDIKNLSHRYKKVIALRIANLVAKRFYDGQPALTVSQIAKELDLTSRLARIIINDFVETGIFVEVRGEKETLYQPGITESKFTVRYVLEHLDRKGTNMLPFENSDELASVNTLMDKVDLLLNNDLGNQKIKDLI